MEAMEDITLLRQNFPLSRMEPQQLQNKHRAEQETGVTTTDLPQSRAQ